MSSGRLRNALASFGLAAGLPRERRIDLAELGSGYGGWTVPAGLIDRTWVCYTAGVGEDASFDLALAQIGCDVVAIDPTPRAIEHLRPLRAEYSNLRLAPYAVWSLDTEIEFYPPANPSHVSFSATNRQRTSDPLRVPARTVPSIACELGHDRVDLLKLDVEGAEYPVLDSLDLAALGVRVLCVEFHNDHGARAMLKAARSVTAGGYRAAVVRRTNVTFIQVDAG